MDMQELRKQYTLERLGINRTDFGRVVSFIDFGNVNYWFEDDRQDHLDNALLEDQKLGIDLDKLHEFTEMISDDARFYYGHDRQRQNSLAFIRAAKEVFGRHRVFTKQMQKVRHHLSDAERKSNTRETKIDMDGIYIHIPKCNFDVEIAIDAVRILDHYDTLCLFSSDADFIQLINYLKTKNKKVILVKGGHVMKRLKQLSDMVISAQNVKEFITTIKQKPGVITRPCGSYTRIHGQDDPKVVK